uniref:Uncharacterized protein n=1 Tax=Arundo donax TaxID=35708 RepID=A0A0A8YAR8_ARUDO
MKSRFGATSGELECRGPARPTAAVPAASSNSGEATLCCGGSMCGGGSSKVELRWRMGAQWY